MSEAVKADALQECQTDRMAIEPALSVTKQLLDLVAPDPVMLLIIENRNHVFLGQPHPVRADECRESDVATDPVSFCRYLVDASFAGTGCHAGVPSSQRLSVSGR